MEEDLRLDEKKLRSYSPLSLAFLGDSVYSLFVKSAVVSDHNMQPEKYHAIVNSYVSAKSQAAFMDSHEDFFTEEEMDVYRRGRNASVHSKAKNATMAEYKKATGLEAVMGYLYLKGDIQRIRQIVMQAMDKDE